MAASRSEGEPGEFRARRRLRSDFRVEEVPVVVGTIIMKAPEVELVGVDAESEKVFGVSVQGIVLHLQFVCKLNCLKLVDGAVERAPNDAECSRATPRLSSPKIKLSASTKEASTTRSSKSVPF